jgi:hypothetical protein
MVIQKPFNGRYNIINNWVFKNLSYGRTVMVKHCYIERLNWGGLVLSCYYVKIHNRQRTLNYVY